MKFKDLEEGKKYNAFNQGNPITENGLNIIYTLRDKLLFSMSRYDFSPFQNNHIAILEFEEIVEYVSFEEAVKHMKKGKNASYENYLICTIIDDIIYRSVSGAPLIFKTELLEPKWILL